MVQGVGSFLLHQQPVGKEIGLGPDSQDFADHDGVVACGWVAGQPAFDGTDAFFDQGGGDVLAPHRGEAAACKFAALASRGGAAAPNRFEQSSARDVDGELAAFEDESPWVWRVGPMATASIGGVWLAGMI
jgi:hypothetical protein